MIHNDTIHGVSLCNIVDSIIIINAIEARAQFDCLKLYTT